MVTTRSGVAPSSSSNEDNNNAEVENLQGVVAEPTATDTAQQDDEDETVSEENDEKTEEEDKHEDSQQHDDGQQHEDSQQHDDSQEHDDGQQQMEEQEDDSQQQSLLLATQQEETIVSVPNDPIAADTTDGADMVKKNKEVSFHEQQDSPTETVPAKTSATSTTPAPRAQTAPLVVVPSQHAVDVLSDLVDYYQELIFLSRENRDVHWKNLKFFWNLHPARSAKFGRTYTRSYICGMLSDSCGQPPYGKLLLSSSDDSSSNQTNYPDIMVEWDRERWDCLITDLSDCRELCLRQDAEVQLNDMTLSESLQNSAAVKRRETHTYFDKKYRTLLHVCEINSAIAPIRFELEQELRNPEATGRPNIDADTIQDILDFTDGLHDAAREYVLTLFQTSSSKEPGVSARELLPFEELRPILSEKPFNLIWVQNKLEVLLQTWSVITFGQVDPLLIRLKYRIDADSETGEVLSASKLARGFKITDKHDDSLKQGLADLKGRLADLTSRHGKDPLEESILIAQAAARPDAADAATEAATETPQQQKRAASTSRNKKSTPKRKKRLIDDSNISNGVSLRFAEELEEADEEEERERAQLSEVPDKSRSILPKDYRGPQPDPGVFSPTGRVTRKRRWTEEEKACVRAGVAKFGMGKWVQIKKEYALVLRNRTAVQIKDCHRTLVKLGEVTEV